MRMAGAVFPDTAREDSRPSRKRVPRPPVDINAGCVNCPKRYESSSVAAPTPRSHGSELRMPNIKKPVLELGLVCSLERLGLLPE